MSAPAPNNQDDGLGRGKRTKKATTKAQANASGTAGQSTAPGLLNAQSQSHASAPALVQLPAPIQPPAQVQAPTQPQVQTQAPAQSQAPAQTQTTQSEPRQTRAQAAAAAAAAQTNTASNAAQQTNTASNAAAGQAVSSAQLPQPRTRTINRRNKTSKTRIDGLMIKIYEEIHKVATFKYRGTRKYSKSYVLEDTHYFLFQARLCRFFDLMSPIDRHTLRGMLMNYNLNSERQKRGGNVVDDAVKALNICSEPGRLRDFCGDPNLLLLTICAHSKSFRKVLERSDDDGRREGEPLWSDVYPVIKTCTSSLELFARSYDFDWVDSLRQLEDHFKVLLNDVYWELRQTTGLLRGVNISNFGIKPGDLDQIHNIPDGQESHIHHHWSLPIEDKQPAVRPMIKYTVTPEMAQTPFVNDFYAVIDRPIVGRPVHAQPTVRLPVDSEQTLKQLDVLNSVILEGQPWPNGADENVLGLPTYCGRPGRPCVACGAVVPDDEANDEANNKTNTKNNRKHNNKKANQKTNNKTNADDSDTIWVKNDGKEASAEVPLCDCTFEELISLRNPAAFKDRSNVLVELYATEDKGRGVRSLQRIPMGTYVGNYVGEIYPQDDPVGNEMNRYGAPEGSLYHYTLPIGARREVSDNKGPDFTIDSGHLGSWTRFMNHHCQLYNVALTPVNLGQRWTTVAIAVKNINFGDEITTDYGPYYFKHLGFNCLCGHSKCKYNNVVGKAEKEAAKRARDESDSEEEQVGKQVGRKPAKARKTTAKETASKTTKGKSSKTAQKGALRRR